MVAADHGFQMARRVAADGAVGGQKVVVIVRVEGGDQLLEFSFDIHLQAGQTLVDQNTGGSVGGDSVNDAVLNAGFLNRFEDVFGNADQLKFFFADQFNGSGFDHDYLTSIPSHLSALPPMSLARVSGRISIFSRPCIMRWLRWRGLLEPNITLSAKLCSNQVGPQVRLKI